MSSSGNKYERVEEAINTGKYRLALRMLVAVTEDAPPKKLDQTGLLYRITIYNRLQWLPEGMELLEHCIAKAGSSCELNLEIALFFMLLGRSCDAERFFRLALDADPTSALIITELAILYEQRGDSDQALKIYNRVFSRGIRRGRADAVFARALARLTGLRELTGDEEKAVLKFIKSGKGTSLETHLYFSMAKHYGRKNNLDKQLQFLKIANDLAYAEDRAGPGEYSASLAKEQLLALKRMFKQPRPDWMPVINAGQNQYLFVLGMPRSGTTLIEQILGAHSRVGNTGESRALQIALSRFSPAKHEGRVVNSKLFEHFRLMSGRDFNEAVKYYQQYQRLLSASEIVTDKELNCVNRVGLLANMFPRAKFIVIKRHPLDVAASLLQHYFKNATYSTRGLNCVLEHEHYYAKVDFWKELYSEKFIEVNYESLVSKPEESIRAMLEKIDLDWEPGLLRFNERTNSVRTPSLSQVRLGLNTAAVNKWKNFSEMLGPAIEYLGIK